ncbi:DUF1365 domain-containing protein [Paraburkholderia sp.]|uniref:DUF1365 domain-containing protein n=1 Tax=Paraburkholderia sp. TaxID=1926495 RepID=UPI003D6FBC5A
MSATANGPLLLLGRVVHARLRPVRHRFAYPVFCVRCDMSRLAELDCWWFGIDRFAPLSLRAADYGACDGGDPATWMRARLAQAGLHAQGPLWLQTFPRVFGYAFNPVSFWFSYDDDAHLRALVAEVRNTFGERHCYLLGAPDGGPIDAHTPLACRKVLHVSPFCDVQGDYAFRVRESADRASISIDYHDDHADGAVLIHTSIALRKQPLTGTTALAALLRQPWMTVAVVARIHWQALRLAIKRVPFYGKHPPSTGATRP